MEDIRNIQAQSLGQVTPGQNRILKRNQRMDEKYLMSKEEAMLGKGPRLGLRPPTITSKTRANEALRKLAQIETKIRSRKQTSMALSDTESDSKTTELHLPKGKDAASAAPSEHPHRTFQKQVCKTPTTKSNGQNGKGSRFLKKKEPSIEARSPVPTVEKGKHIPPPRQKEPARKCDAPDSDEEEIKALLGSLMDSSREEETNRNHQLTSTKVSMIDHGKLSSVRFSFVGFNVLSFLSFWGWNWFCKSRADGWLRDPPICMYMCICIVTTHECLGAYRDR